jgi:TonB family protein
LLHERRLNMHETDQASFFEPHDAVSRTATALVRKYYRSIFSVGNKISKSYFVEADQSGESLLRVTAMSAISKQLVNALDRPTQDPAARSIVQSAETLASHTNPVSAEVPVGVLEVPVEVWGSRPGVSISGRPGRIDVFAEETCTVIVFPHGAVIRLSATVAPGQMMMVTNRKSRQVVPCRVVNVRNYPNVRGYAEIEFFQSVNDFWGPYIPQGTLNLPERIQSAIPEKPPKPGSDAPSPASTQARTLAPSATSSKPPAAASTAPENFLSSTFPKEATSIFANAAAASPAPDPTVRNEVDSIESRAIQTPSVEKSVQRAAMAVTPSESRFDAMNRNISEPNPLVSVAIANSSMLGVPSTQEHQQDESASEPSARSWNRGLWGSLRGPIITRTATDGSPSRRPRMVFVCIVMTSLFTMGAAAIFLLNRGTAQSAATTQTNPAPVASTVSSIANTTQSLQPQSNSSSVVSDLPIIANIDSFPGTHGRELAHYARSSHPTVRMPSLERKIPNGTLLAPPSVARRSVAAIGRNVAPDLSGVDSNTGATAIQRVLAASAVSGSRMKEPKLVSRSVPIYPTMAKQAGVEGQVTIDAVIDTTGRLTSMKVVSGALLLQQAALDSLRNWKYEPGYLDDKPVPVSTSITVKFRLR